MSRVEIDQMRRLQTLVVRGPVPQLARGLSWWGEHARGWLALATVGALVDRRHRSTWVRVGVSAFAAHGAAVVVKRVVRRRRPDDPQVRVLVATPSDLSFPSAHAASTTAAMIAMVPLVGRPVAAVVTVAMAAARVTLGVHFPTDVVAGALLGASANEVVGRLRDRG